MVHKMYKVKATGIALQNIVSDTAGFLRRKGVEYTITVTVPITFAEPDEELLIGLFRLTDAWLQVTNLDYAYIGEQDL